MSITSTLINNPMIKPLLEAFFKAGWESTKTKLDYEEAKKQFFEAIIKAEMEAK